MTPLANSRWAAHAEHGAVMVMVAIFAPVAILFASMAIDVGNAYLHRRHLQLQADAGALAAAQEFLPCSSQAIEASAKQYSGVAGAPLYNSQIAGTTGTVHEELNSKTYYHQSSPVDASAVEKPPCEADMVDVKLTETNLPWYLKMLPETIAGVPYINAHARVEILQQKVAKGAEPLAVAESAPVAASVYYVNEDKGNEIIASGSLVNTGPNGKGEEVWSSEASPTSVAIKETNATTKTAHIGVVIALSGNAKDTKCGDTYVKCFDQTSAGPLLHIAGYSNEGTATMEKPLARQVTLSSLGGNTCSDGYYSTTSTSCTFTISAKVEYGSTITKGVTVTPEIGKTTGTALTYSSTTGLWSGTVTHSGEGSNEVNLIVRCKKETGSPCSTKATEATIADVQRIYAADTETASAIGGAWIGVQGGASTDANSFEVCEAKDEKKCTYQLYATVDVGGSLADAQAYSDPLYKMRAGSPTGEVIGCSPGAESSGSAYREHLALGCPGSFTVNTSDPKCTSTTEPYDCIGFASGLKTGPFKQGLESRVEKEPPTGTRYYCPNNWVNDDSGGVPAIPKDDSRVIEIFIEPYGSNGSESAPIQSFADFYVTGYSGDNCKSDESVGNGEIVGHFIKYINVLDNEGGGEKCVPSALGPCVAVLTR